MTDQEKRFGARIPGILGRNLIPILALSASVLTFWISFNLTSNQQAEAEQRLMAEDARSAEQEVREILQQINQVRPQLMVSQELLEADALFKDMTLLASQSYRLAEDFGSHLSAFELANIAEALLDTNQYPEASQIITKGVEQIQTPSEHFYTYRIQGRISFVLGDLEAGRTALESAIAGHPDRKFPEGYEPVIDAQTEYLWASLEAVAHECNEARLHFVNGSAQESEVAETYANEIAPIAAAAEQLVFECEPKPETQGR